MVAAGALLMRSVSGNLSRANKDVKLYDMVMLHEADPQDMLTIELDAFYGMGGTVEELTERYHAIQTEFKRYATIAGALIGLVFGITLINLSVKRSRKLYEIDHANCVDCGRCFSYCPQNLKTIENKFNS